MALSRAVQGVKLPILSKKMYFLGRKWHFFEKNNVLDILIGVSLGMRSLHIYNIW